MSRLILVPQLPVYMRYSEWWLPEATKHLSEHFEVVVLGTKVSRDVDRRGSFSSIEASVRNELLQVREFTEMRLCDDDVLLHMDLSFPGLFHSALALKRPKRCVVFCHASAKNAHDLFAPVRGPKWFMEKGSAGLYDKVLVATKYHADKLNLPNVRIMGALPYPPRSLHQNSVYYEDGEDRVNRFVSVSRPCRQKVNQSVECELEKLGYPVIREHFTTWAEYYSFLGSSQFLIITSREETFGYQVMDAILMGCVPIAPNKFSYPELLPPSHLYEPDVDPALTARRILSTTTWDSHVGSARPDRPPLLCDAKAKAFWSNLVRELTTWE